MSHSILDFSEVFVEVDMQISAVEGLKFEGRLVKMESVDYAGA